MIDLYTTKNITYYIFASSNIFHFFSYHPLKKNKIYGRSQICYLVELILFFLCSREKYVSIDKLERSLNLVLKKQCQEYSNHLIKNLFPIFLNEKYTFPVFRITYFLLVSGMCFILKFCKAVPKNFHSIEGRMQGFLL